MAYPEPIGCCCGSNPLWPRLWTGGRGYTTGSGESCGRWNGEQKIPLVIIAPDSPITLGRFEKDPEKLLELYHMGRRDAENKGEELMALLG